MTRRGSVTPIPAAEARATAATVDSTATMPKEARMSPREKPVLPGTTGVRTGSRVALWIIGALTLACLLGAGIVFIPPALRLGAVKISGCASIPEGDLRKALGLKGTETMISLDFADLERRVQADPRVKSATVRPSFPSTLLVSVVERRPVAYILAMVDGGMRPLLVDDQGFIFGWGYGALPPLPLISGLSGERLVPGTALSPELAPTFASLGQIDDPGHRLLSAFSEILILHLGVGGIELRLYPLHARIPVRTGPVLDIETMHSIVMALDVLGSGQAGEVLEIDARSGTLVYRSKEEQTG